MAKDKCVVRIAEALKRSSIDSVKADEILADIKQAQAEVKIQNIDSKITNELSDKILQQKKIDKKIKERNNLENEVKIRKTIDYVLEEFPNDPVEGLRSILVGSNLQKAGSRFSVALSQLTMYRNFATSFEARLRAKELDGVFANATADQDRRITRAIQEIGEGKEITVKDVRLVEIAKIMSEFQEQVRLKLNSAGANIPKIWGYIVRQSHDPFQLRNAVDVLKIKRNKNIDATSGNGERNLQAWIDYIFPKLDSDRTFGKGVTQDEKISFLRYAYNSLIKNEHQIADGAGTTYGSRDLTKKLNAKRVLHFKTSDDWFDYNSKFGGGNLRESFFSGLNIAARNYGLMKDLGTKPQENLQKIGRGIAQALQNQKKTDQAEKVSTAIKTQGNIEKYMMEVDGSVNSVVNFGAARYSAIARSIQSMAKLGGAVVSALADIHLYASEVSYQGRSYMGGIFEAMGSLSKLKNKRRTEISSQLGFISDNAIYDLAARYSVGDQLNRSFTKLQRTFFKLNLLSWWTNSLKEGAMLGMGNYIAKQRKTSFNNLEDGFKRLLKHYDIDEKTWNVIRKMDIEKADDGTEFFSVKKIDDLSDDTIKSLAGLEKMSKRQIDLFKDDLKTQTSGMFLDRSTFAVIEPDARQRAFMKQGFMAGTGPGEAIRFIAQFKAFPIAILDKAVGRELSFIKEGQNMRAFMGISRLIIMSGIFGYIAMTAKDLVKGKSPKDPLKKKTFFASMLQGGGLGIYGDFLFQQSNHGLDILSTIAGPGISEGAKVLNAIRLGVQGEYSRAAKNAYKSVINNTPFLNLFYLKFVFDHAIGYQMMETLSPGYLRRMERRMKKDTGQHFLLTKPSTLFKGF
jgi:hypothetical protein